MVRRGKGLESISARLKVFVEELFLASSSMAQSVEDGKRYMAAIAKRLYRNVEQFDINSSCSVSVRLVFRSLADSFLSSLMALLAAPDHCV